MSEDVKVVFYDGDCGFCNRSVAFVLKNDASNSIHYAALQSEYCAKLFRENKWPEPDMSTFYFYESGRLYSKSTAALKVANYFSFPQNLMKIGWIIPRFIRDGIYDQIAKRRKRLSIDYCVVPSKDQRERFL